MNQTGGADRPGPAPNAVRETQKRGVVRQALQGLHGPLLLGCGQGLAPQGSSANGGRFRQFMPEGQQALNPSALAAIQPCPGFAPSAHAPTTLPLAAERPLRRQCQNEAHRNWTRPHNCPGLRRGCCTSEERPEVRKATLEVGPQRQGRASPCAIRLSPASTPPTDTVASVRP